MTETEREERLLKELEERAWNRSDPAYFGSPLRGFARTIRAKMKRVYAWFVWKPFVVAMELEIKRLKAHEGTDISDYYWDATTEQYKRKQLLGWRKYKVAD